MATANLTAIILLGAKNALSIISPLSVSSLGTSHLHVRCAKKGIMLPTGAAQCIKIFSDFGESQGTKTAAVRSCVHNRELLHHLQQKTFLHYLRRSLQLQLRIRIHLSLQLIKGLLTLESRGLRLTFHPLLLTLLLY